MTNYQVAHAMICQTLNLLEGPEDCDKATVIQYLTYAETLLQNPEEENYEHPGPANWKEGFDPPVTTSDLVLEDE